MPYTRGAEYSRRVEAIITEAEQLVQQGAREITLLGQNVNAFHGEDANGKIWTFGELLFRLAAIPNLKRLRYMTSHPRDMDDTLLAAHRDLPQLMPFLHLPVQSGSDAILAAMNRKHSVDDYRRCIDRMREVRPDLAVSSDFIIGFPGESDQDFAATLDLIRNVGFAQAYSFKYSRRPGTPAAAMTAQIDEAIKDARLQEAQTLIGDQQKAFNRQSIGNDVTVLFDSQGRRPGQIHGRTPHMQSVHVTAPASLIGREVLVHVTTAGMTSLTGDVVMADAA